MPYALVVFAGLSWIESPNTMFCLRFSGESNIGRRTLVAGSFVGVGCWWVVLLEINRCHTVGRGRTIGEGLVGWKLVD